MNQTGLAVLIVALAAWLLLRRAGDQLPAVGEAIELPDRSWTPPSWAGWTDAAAEAMAIEPAGWLSPMFQPDPPDLVEDQPSQAAGIIEAAAVTVTEAAAAVPELLGITQPPPADQVERNRRAMLDAIAWAEGTAKGPDNGYRVLFGWPAPDRTFTSYADHPRRLFAFTDKAGRQLKTSAAGRYQFIAPTWDDVRARLALPDFSPASQDAAAIELIRQRGALRDVDAGRLVAAVAKIRTVWASLPGAGYDQPERKLAELQAAYQQAGGTLEA